MFGEGQRESKGKRGRRGREGKKGELGGEGSWDVKKGRPV